MATIVIPARSTPNAYKFKIDLEGVNYVLDFGWNQRSARWYMSIFQKDGETLLVGDIPILINVPLHDQYVDERLPPGRFIALDETGKNRQPIVSNFGTEIKLFYEESI